MNALARTRRLLVLYTAQERAAEARLQAAGADLLRAANLHALCLAVQRETGRHRREALAAGDAAEHAIRHSLLAAGIVHLGLLQQAVMALQAVRDDAATTHKDSRMEAAQMEQLVSRTAQEMQQQSVRRDQLDSDDRFAARRLMRDGFSMTEP